MFFYFQTDFILQTNNIYFEERRERSCDRSRTLPLRLRWYDSLDKVLSSHLKDRYYVLDWRMKYSERVFVSESWRMESVCLYWADLKNGSSQINNAICFLMGYVYIICKLSTDVKHTRLPVRISQSWLFLISLRSCEVKKRKEGIC